MWDYEIFYRLAIFSINDGIEIIAIASLFYSFSIWLKQDQQKPLVLYFYGLATMMLLTDLVNLPTLSNSFFALSPAIIMLFILVHQKSLQKNFVALKNIQPSELINSNWLDILLRACLISTNQKQKVACLIEGKDALSELLNSPFILRTKIQASLLEALLNSTNYDQQKMIWVSNTGLLLSINVDWKSLDSQANSQSQTIDEWQQISLLYTAQADAIVFRIAPQERTFDIIAEGKLLEGLPIDQAIKLIQSYCLKKTGQDLYDKSNSKKSRSPFYT